ncbi:MAG: hypothetical protein CMG62_02990 [Candidatus Marinimicrobia bacterium]|nr:hypothetical protein [Candidatus Neomarinimicrobiota bacterium]
MYTCISGEYDSLIEPKSVEPGYDFICFTNNKNLKSENWSIKPLVKNFNNNKKNNRYHKMNPHLLFKNHKYSVYIDGNIGIVGKHFFNRVRELIEDDIKISMPKHPLRECIYEEAKETIRSLKSDPKKTIEQIKYLKKKGYPESNGLVEAGIIFRRHNDAKVIELMNSWWAFFLRFPTRDQLAFNFIIWQKEIFDFSYFFDGYNQTLRDSSDYFLALHNYEKKGRKISNRIIRKLRTIYCKMIYRKYL